MPDDPMRYRIALIEGFRRRGIYPRDVRTLADDALRWRNPLKEIGADDFSGMLADFSDLQSRKQAQKELAAWRVSMDRQRIADTSDDLQVCARDWLIRQFRKQARRDPTKELVGWWAGERTVLSALGLALSPDSPQSLYRNDNAPEPTVQVHSVRYALRPRQDGNVVRDVVVEVIQRRRGYYDPDRQKKVDTLRSQLPHDDSEVSAEYRPDFVFRGGFALLIDGETGLVRYVIAKDILSQERLELRRRYERGDATSAFGMTFEGVQDRDVREPFAMLHRGY